MKLDSIIRELGAWSREIGGWLLVLIGLAGFYESWRMLRSFLIFESWPMVLVSFFIFRGGIQLLKVAVAARLSRRADQDLAEAALRPRLALPKSTPIRK